MRFAIVSLEAVSLSWWKRLQDEGHEVLVYIKPGKNGKRSQQYAVGDGIVNKATSELQLMSWAYQKKNETIFIFDGSGEGAWADGLRRQGFLVVGGGEFADKLEKKRAWAEGLARECGMLTPPSHEFSTISQAIAFVESASDDTIKYVFKSDRYLEASATYVSKGHRDLIRQLKYYRKRFGDNVKNILQEKIDGVAVSTAGWWNGTTFLTPFEGTIEHKAVMNSDLGGSTGCSLNLVWFYNDTMPKIVEALHFDKLEEIMRRERATPGIYDINAVISNENKQPYFLEFTPRFGYDSEMTGAQALKIPLGSFLTGLATGTLTVAPFDVQYGYMGLRLTVSPYPWEHLPDEYVEKKSAKGTPIEVGDEDLWSGQFVAYGVMRGEDGFELADPGGLVGLVTSYGTDIDGMGEDIQEYIDEIEIPNLQYRTDIAKMISKDMLRMRELGYEVNKDFTTDADA